MSPLSHLVWLPRLQPVKTIFLGIGVLLARGKSLPKPKFLIVDLCDAQFSGREGYCGDIHTCHASYRSAYYFAMHETPVRSTYIYTNGCEGHELTTCAHTSIQLTNMSQRVSDMGVYPLGFASKLRTHTTSALTIGHRDITGHI